MRLFYREYGTEHTDTVVLLHGYLSDGRYWSSVVKRLKQTHHVIAIDLLGFGKSPKPRPVIRSSSKNTHASRRKSLRHTIERTNAIELLQSIPLRARMVQGTQDREIYRDNLNMHTKLVTKNTTIRWVDTGHHAPALLPDFSYQLIINASMS